MQRSPNLQELKTILQDSSQGLLRTATFWSGSQKKNLRGAGLQLRYKKKLHASHFVCLPRTLPCHGLYATQHVNSLGTTPKPPLSPHGVILCEKHLTAQHCYHGVWALIHNQKASRCCQNVFCKSTKGKYLLLNTCCGLMTLKLKCSATTTIVTFGGNSF